jgi:hypothetical protein
VTREGRKASLRCAIYTRVSTENGLEQEFNSLDNQREASEAWRRLTSRTRTPMTICGGSSARRSYPFISAQDWPGSSYSN